MENGDNNLYLIGLRELLNLVYYISNNCSILYVKKKIILKAYTDLKQSYLNMEI